jgi:4-amino-4-deoxy-L-arabinose transferase-like glycosyltransferase
LLIGLLALALLTNLHRPPLQWDEGWTLALARDWLETGRYGVLNGGHTDGTHGAAAPPLVMSVAASYRVFGVSIWAGRLPALLYGFGALALLWYLSSRLYDRRVAWWALGVGCVGMLSANYMPLLYFRLAMAESIMLFWLLLAYVLLLSVSRNAVLIIPAGAALAVALASKGQPLPFVCVSFAVMIGVAAWCQRWRDMWRVSQVLVLALGLRAWYLGVDPLGVSNYRQAVDGQIEAVALVLTSLEHRQWALVQGIFVGGPLPVAAVVLPSWGRDRAAVVRLGLLALVIAWWAWYTLGSNGTPRYLFPALYLGAPFLAAWLARLTQDFAVWPRWSKRLRLGAVAVAVLITIANMLYGDDDAQQVAVWLSQRPGTVETYSSQIVWAVGGDRVQHPPTQLHIDRQRQQVGLEPLLGDYVPPPSRWLVTDEEHPEVYNTAGMRAVAEFGRYTVWDNTTTTPGN